MADYVATRWYAQFLDGTKSQGGSGSPLDVPLATVDTARLKSFTIAHNTYTHLYRAEQDEWWIERKLGTYTYPTTYSMSDGSTLHVDFDYDIGHLILTKL